MIVAALIVVLGAVALGGGRYRRRLKVALQHAADVALQHSPGQDDGGQPNGQLQVTWRRRGRVGRTASGRLAAKVAGWGRARRAQAGAADAGQDAAAYLGRVAAGLRSGLPPGEAFVRADLEGIGWAEDVRLAVAAGTGSGRAIRELADAAEQAPTGTDARASARNAHERSMLAALAAAIDVSERVGTPLADMLDRLSLTLDDIADADADRSAAVAGPAASARLLSWLPLVGLGLGELMGADPIGVLLDGAAGTAVGCLGIGVMWVGRRWSMRLVRQAAGGRDRPRRRRARARFAIGPRRRLTVATPESVPTSATDMLVVVDLIAAVLLAGVTVPDALRIVGSACPGTVGKDLQRVADRLADQPWTQAWHDAVTHQPELRWVCEALAVSWHMGASSAPQLRRVHARIARHRRAEAKTAAQRLAVHLVLPLGLCLLPAFFLLGLAPLAMSLIGQFLGTTVG